MEILQLIFFTAIVIAAIAKSSPGVIGTMERMSSANDYIAKALESSPNGWMIIQKKYIYHIPHVMKTQKHLPNLWRQHFQR